MTGKALSIRQPWAWLIVHGPKDVENRDWRHDVNNRGPLFIHASKRFDMEGYHTVRLRFPDIAMPRPAQFDRGGIVGRADLADCVTQHPSLWFTGPRGLMLLPHELAAAQGFPVGYWFSGNRSEQIKQIGNAVPPPFAEAITSQALAA